MSVRPDGKHRVFQFRLSAKDRQRIDRLAKQHELKPSAYIRKAALGELQKASA